MLEMLVLTPARSTGMVEVRRESRRSGDAPEKQARECYVDSVTVTAR